MSENTIFRIRERDDGAFDVSRHWFEEGEPPLPGYNLEGVSLRAATEYCEARHAEYGYHIVWLDEEEVHHGIYSTVKER